MNPVSTHEISALERQRGSLVARLEARRTEIEQSALTRVNTLSPPVLAADPQYLDGLRRSVGAAIDYALASIASGEEDQLPVPPLLLTQARLAVRSSVPIDTVMRRYFAGFTLLSSFVFDEAGRSRIRPSTLEKLMREQSLLFDRFLGHIATAYAEEEEKLREDQTERKLIARLQKLLAGDLVDTSGLDYDFTACHLAAIGIGKDAERVMQQLASELDCRLFLVRLGDEIWGWLACRQAPSSQEIQIAVSRIEGAIVLALGEPGQSLSGWRITHNQAKAALPIAVRSQKATRYSDIALLASVLQDDLLTASLREIYLRPLGLTGARGEVLRETLKSYFKADRSVSSAAARLRVKRHTVTNRLRLIEERMERPLTSCAAALEVALEIDDLLSEGASRRPISP